MKINKDWQITADSMNVTLMKQKRRISKKDGKPYYGWEVYGYYATPEEALHGLVKQEIRDTDLTDLKTIVGKTTELHKLIQDINPNALLSVSQRHTGVLSKV